MNVTILYFAALRERVGTGREVCALPANVTTVDALKGWLASRGAPWSDAFDGMPRIRAAVDQAMAVSDTALHDGAEVAFFPPVTGG